MGGILEGPFFYVAVHQTERHNVPDNDREISACGKTLVTHTAEKYGISFA